MIGLIRYYQRNKILYEILEQTKKYSDEEYALDKYLIIRIGEDKEIETELRMNDLSFLNPYNIGYAIVKDMEKGICLIADKYEKDGQAEIIPFIENKVTIETTYKKKNYSISFEIVCEKISE